MTVIDRYNRQELIKGWNQELLSNARIAVIGSGYLANYTLTALAALGIGNLEIYDTAKVGEDKEFLLFSAELGESKVKSLEKILSKINPVSKIKGVGISFETPSLALMLGKPEIVIDVTNSSKSKSTILNYASSKGINVISASSDDDMAEVFINNLKENAFLKEYNGVKQGRVVSGIIGGMIAEEVRKMIMPLDKNDIPAKTAAYSLSAQRRFSKEKEGKFQKSDLKDKKILIVGAGALGNFAALGAALEGIGNIDILDFDEVDSTNLNRQILFYESVGKKKARALAEKILEIVPSANVKGIVGKLSEDSNYFKKNKPDAILDCVDSFAVRAIINYFAVRNNIPLISGGTNPRSGQVIVYEPGLSACLDCKIEVEKALAEQRKAASCRFAPDPSVIMTNQITGNMMVGEALKILDKNRGEPVRRILKYDSVAPVRGGLVGPGESCSCTKPEIKEWLGQIDQKLENKQIDLKTQP
ncbi:ThiF family adenylyltransferase [Candidatus Woesearchaeota archaeon]|nr:ThiF family adenylyltransferase [Candidatus Woesearchaeota archaeon]